MPQEQETKRLACLAQIAGLHFKALIEGAADRGDEEGIRRIIASVTGNAGLPGSETVIPRAKSAAETVFYEMTGYDSLKGSFLGEPRDLKRAMGALSALNYPQEEIAALGDGLGPIILEKRPHFDAAEVAQIFGMKPGSLARHGAVSPNSAQKSGARGKT